MLIRFLILLIVLFTISACNKPSPSTNTDNQTQSSNIIMLTFTYGSEKEKWVEDVTQVFNQANYKIASDKVIQIKAIPMGSGESMKEIIEDKRQVHITSPASQAFITLYNDKWEEKTGNPLIKETHNLVLSPVIIAMWKPMAEALGWGSFEEIKTIEEGEEVVTQQEKQISWYDILTLVNNPEGWGAYNYPHWGSFKFGHTHPEYSNSGLISLLAIAYAGAEKQRGLTLSDIEDPKVQAFLQNIEQSIVHYGRSTGFFGRKMYKAGPEYLSAAILYENMVIESYDKKHHLPFPIVAIYPKEGTFWSDHPIGIVEREWLTPEHREAAKIYIDFLLAKAQQEKAMVYGFRPADPSIALSDKFGKEYGVDPTQPKTKLSVPKANVIYALLDLWKEHKKHANVVLVLDTSGSMKGEKIQNARQGAISFLQAMTEKDKVSVISFNSTAYWIIQDMTVTADNKQQIKGMIETLYAGGSTALYDSLLTAKDYLNQEEDSYINAIVLLSDGEDTASKSTLAEVFPIKVESKYIPIFPIAYGEGADKNTLESIAEHTKTKVYTGKPQDIIEIFHEISTFF